MGTFHQLDPAFNTQLNSRFAMDAGYDQICIFMGSAMAARLSNEMASNLYDHLHLRLTQVLETELKEGRR